MSKRKWKWLYLISCTISQKELVQILYTCIDRITNEMLKYGKMYFLTFT